MISKPREAAALVLCIGTVLWLPPIALIFGKPLQVLDIPLPVFYLFGTWMLLVAAAVVISRRLPNASDSSD